MYPIEPPVSPMLAKLARELPTSGGKAGDFLFEPKWDGFRAIIFRDGDDVEIGSRNEKPLTRYFPDLIEPLRANLPDRCVVDGEIVIATERGLDFDLLSLRIHPAASRVAMLAEETPASFVAFDLLADADGDLREHPFRERRARLEAALARARPPVQLTPATTDRATAHEWFEHFEGAGLDGVVAKPLDGAYEEGKRTMQKVKHLRTADCVVGGFRVHKDGVGVGSLLLGLYDDDGVLHHVGVASSFAAPVRDQLLGELEPYRDGALEGHPWRTWAEADAGAPESAAESGQRRPGAQSRWNAGKDLSWEPLRLELVAEVAYEHLQGDRFRHTARFQRWRPDREPSSCTYEQLDVPVPMELQEIFGIEPGGNR
jgi:ATP-dependent DNA ligase